MPKRAVPEIAKSFISEHEKCVLRVYDDQQPHKILAEGDHILGTLTAAYGHTGPDLHIGMVVTKPMADQWLKEDLHDAADTVERRVGADVCARLNVYQYAALIAFAFNVRDDSWTLWRRVKAGQFDQVPLELMKFTRSGGKKMAGLVNRRSAEVALWSTLDDHAPVPRHSAEPVSTSPKPLMNSRTMNAGKLGIASTTGAGVLEMVGSFKEQLQDLTYYVEWAKYVLLALVLVSFAITLYARWDDHKKAAR